MTWLWVVVVLVAVMLDAFLVGGHRRYVRLKRAAASSSGSKSPPIYILLKSAFGPDYLRELWAATKPWLPRAISDYPNVWGTGLEVLMIAGWALLVGHTYLNMDPRVVPTGYEFGSSVPANYLWTQVRQCGLCALWNGSQNGGFPSFANVHGSALHPLVAVSTAAWGVINGAKITLLASFFLAGVSQWWIARTLNLGWLPRMWSAALGAAGGHLTGRMELGSFGMVLSMAMCSLWLAGVLHLARTGGRRAAVLLAILTASLAVAGQGYMQLAALGVLPAVALLVLDEKGRLLPVWKRFALALVLGLMLAAPFLVPLVHFGPNIAKYTDATFSAAQPLAYVPLNLVINDVAFYYSPQTPGTLPYPHLYMLYIGWTPVLLALVGLAAVRPRDRRVIGFMAACAFLAFLMGSGTIPRLLVTIWPAIAGARHPSHMAGLAVPMILGLSAYGLDHLLRRPMPWAAATPRPADVSRSWLAKLPIHGLLVLALALNTHAVYSFSQRWLGTWRMGDDVFHILSALKTNSLEWVEPPFGAHAFVAPGVEMGLKLSRVFSTWAWRDRQIPDAILYEKRQGRPHTPQGLKIGVVEDVELYSFDAPYASVATGAAALPCAATGAGGDINVVCDLDEPGLLTVRENTWSGWYAWVDGSRLALQDGQWLAVNAPAGRHSFVFRYRPWDVPLGMALFLAGVIACIGVYRKGQA